MLPEAEDAADCDRVDRSLRAARGCALVPFALSRELLRTGGSKIFSPFVSSDFKSRPFDRDSPASGPPMGVSMGFLCPLAARGRFCAGGRDVKSGAAFIGVDLNEVGRMLEIRLGSGRRALGPWSWILGKVVSATVDGVLESAAGAAGKKHTATHSQFPGLPINPNLGACAATPGVKNDDVVGAAVANGLICRRLMKFGTSDADDLGIGAGDRVGLREVLADERNVGGSGNMASGEGGAPACQP